MNLARKQKLDPVIGRDQEIRNVIRILSRKTKNNPCLISEPGGVGIKTAIAEGAPSVSCATCARKPERPHRVQPGHGRSGGRCKVPQRVRGTARAY